MTKTRTPSTNPVCATIETLIRDKQAVYLAGKKSLPGAVLVTPEGRDALQALGVMPAKPVKTFGQSYLNMFDLGDYTERFDAKDLKEASDAPQEMNALLKTMRKPEAFKEFRWNNEPRRAGSKAEEAPQDWRTQVALREAEPTEIAL